MAKSGNKKTTSKKSIFTLNDSNRTKLRVISAILERDQQDIVNEALTDWFARYEKKNGILPVKQ